jgi:hypothetical protein
MGVPCWAPGLSVCIVCVWGVDEVNMSILGFFAYSALSERTCQSLTGHILAATDRSLCYCSTVIFSWHRQLHLDQSAWFLLVWLQQVTWLPPIIAELLSPVVLFMLNDSLVTRVPPHVSTGPHCLTLPVSFYCFSRLPPQRVCIKYGTRNLWTRGWENSILV